MVPVEVPTIDKRERIPQEAIDQVVEQIVEKFKPQKRVGSPLAVDGIRLNLTRWEILESIEEGRSFFKSTSGGRERGEDDLLPD